MKKLVLVLAVSILTAAAALANSRVHFSAGVSGGEAETGAYYMAVGNYNRIQERQVIVVRQRGISDEDLPVVFFIASKAGVSYDDVITLRLRGWSWMKIALKYRIDPGVFYMPVSGRVINRTYARQYNYYQGRPQSKWKKIRLSDRDIVNFVNLRFVSEHYGYNPHEVMQMRDKGRSFVQIDTHIRAKKAKAYNDKRAKEKNSRGRNKR